jgi:hypothetical protein
MMVKKNRSRHFYGFRFFIPLEYESFVHTKRCCDVEENLTRDYVRSILFKASLNKKMWLLDYHLLSVCICFSLARERLDGHRFGFGIGEFSQQVGAW